MGMKSFGLRHALLMSAAALGLGIGATVAPPAYAQEATRSYDIPAQDLDDALREFGRQTGRDVLFTPDAVAGKRSGALVGQMTERQALESLLAGSGLRFEQTASGGYAVQDPNSPTRLGDAGDAASSDDEAYSEILVVGRRTLNADIRRTEDDVQPYVVFDAEEIQNSQATNLDDFFRSRLPMNTATSPPEVSRGADAGTTSFINLRGLGQTLVLVDGRRLPNTTNVLGFNQSDINGIPLAAIDRIEVLPSTSGGIYGADAVGGVINVILKRDYSGFDIQGLYGSTFDGNAVRRALDLSAGFSLEDGRTQVLMSASRADGDDMITGDRDYAVRARALMLQNDPQQFFNTTVPPLGATPNIRSVSGNLVLDDGTPLNSRVTYSPTGYTAASGTAGFLTNAGQYNLALPNDLSGLQSTLVNSPTTSAYLLNVRREFAPGLDVFVDLQYNLNEGSALSKGGMSSTVRLAAGAPNNPFQQAIFVSFPSPNVSFETRSESETAVATIGAIAQLPADWRAELDYTQSHNSFTAWSTGPVLNAAGSAALSSGALDVLQDPNTNPLDFTPYLLSTPNVITGPFQASFQTAALRLGGPAFELPGGKAMLSILMEYRDQTADAAIQESLNTSVTPYAPSFLYFPERSENVTSAFASLTVPLVSEMNALPLVHDLELQLSARHDEHSMLAWSLASIGEVPSRDGPFPSVAYSRSEFGSSNYTIGLRYAPTADLTFRISAGTGFRPPALEQLAPEVIEYDGSAPFFIYADPQRGGDFGPGVGGEGPLTVYFTGNPNLKPEESDSISWGAILTPRVLPGFRFSIDFTNIQRHGEIRSLDADYVLAHEDVYADRIVREPGPLTADDITAGYTARPITLFDLSPVNISESNVEAIDIQADYTVELDWFGSLRLYAIATQQRVFNRRVLPEDPLVDVVGFRTSPLEWRGNFGFNLVRGPLTLDWNAQYYDGFKVYSSTQTPSQVASLIAANGREEFPAQIFHDLTMTYRFGDSELFGSLPLANTTLALGIQDIFDEGPLISASTEPRGGFVSPGNPQGRRFSVRLRQSF